MVNKRLTNKHWLRGSLLAFLAVLLVAVAGCQAVGTVDLNRVLLNQYDVNTMEGKGYLELSFDFDDQALADPVFREENGIPSDLDLTRFSSFKLVYDELKVDAEGDFLFKGALEWADGSIPFSIHADEQTMLIRLDDVLRPFAISLADETLPVSVETQQLMNSMRETVKRVASYWIHNLPNPPSIRVDWTSEPINGTTQSLAKVQAEWNGQELGRLLPAYLDALVQDEQGLTDAVRATMDLEKVIPGISEETESSDEQLSDLVTNVQLMLKLVKEQLASLEKDDPVTWQAVFNAGHSFKFNLYVDSSLTVRKLEQEFHVDLAAIGELAGESFRVRGVTLRAGEERWNINGNVEVPDVTVPPSALTEEELDNLEAYRFLRLVNPDSALYRLLKDDLAIDDQEAVLYDSWDGPFVERNGVLYVPIRETLDDFDIQVQYSKKDKTVRFYDGPTGREFALRSGSTEVRVGGETVRWTRPALTIDGKLYVPADEFFKLFGATYERTVDEDGDTMLQVKRDL